MNHKIALLLLTGLPICSNATDCNQELTNRSFAVETAYNEQITEFHRLKDLGDKVSPGITANALFDAMDTMIVYRDLLDEFLLSCGYRMSESDKDQLRTQLNDLSRRINIFTKFANAQMERVNK